MAARSGPAPVLHLAPTWVGVLDIHYDRKATHFLAFLTLAAAPTCLDKPTKRAT